MNLNGFSFSFHVFKNYIIFSWLQETNPTYMSTQRKFLRTSLGIRMIPDTRRVRRLKLVFYHPQIDVSYGGNINTISLLTYLLRRWQTPQKCRVKPLQTHLLRPPPRDPTALNFSILIISEPHPTWVELIFGWKLYCV